MKNRQNHPNDPRTYVGAAGPAALFSDLRHVEALLAGDQRFPRFQRNRAIPVTRVRLFRPFIQATTWEHSAKERANSSPNEQLTREHNGFEETG